AIALEQIAPFGVPGSTARADAVGEMLIHAVGHQELRILRPAIEALGILHLLFAERFTMRLRRVLLVWRAIADMAFDDDDAGTGDLLPGEIEGAKHLLLIIGVAHMENVPAQAQEAGSNVFGKGDFGVTFDRDPVRIVDPAELVEPQMPGQRRRL